MARHDLHRLLLDLADDEADIDAERRAAVERALPWVEFLAEVRRGGPGGWRRDAACRGMVHVMFPAKGQSTELARLMCNRCTVRVQCEQWVLEADTDQRGGIVAGMSERERAAVRRHRDAEAA